VVLKLIAALQPEQREACTGVLKNYSIDIEACQVETLVQFKKKLRSFNPDLVIINQNSQLLDTPSALMVLEEKYQDIPVIIIKNHLANLSGSVYPGITTLELIENNQLETLTAALLRILHRKLNGILDNAETISSKDAAKDRTEKSKLELDLNNARQKLQTIFDSVNDAIFIYDINSLQIVELNDQAALLYGYPKEELKTMHFGQLSVEESGFTQDLAENHVRNAIDGNIVSGEWLALSKNGRQFWVHALLKKIHYGGVERLMATVKDIDQQKHTEKSLLERENQYHTFIEHSPDVIMRFDRNHRHLFVNKEVKNAVGIEPEVFFNKTHKEMGVFPDHMCDFWEKQIEKVFTSAKSHKAEFSIGEGSSVKYYEWRLSPEINPSGEVATVLAIARDITELTRASRSLISSEERLKLALDATSDGLWDWHIKTGEIYFSPRYFTMLGYSPDDFIHDQTVLFTLMHPSEREEIKHYIEKVIEEKRETLEMEIRLQRQDGGYAWILSRGKVCSFDHDGNPVRIIGTHVDISQRKRQETVKEVLYEIANAINSTKNLFELFETIQNSLGKVVDTRNCYVALYNEKTDKLTLPFHRDEKDSFNEFPAGKTLTGYVIKTGKSQLIGLERIAELENAGLIELVGAPSVYWLGVPLRLEGHIVGVFAVQSYDEQNAFTEDDVQLLEFVSDQIAIAIQRKTDQDELRKTQESQRRIIESSPDGLAVIDYEGRILDFNSSFPDMLRIIPLEVKEHNFFEFVSDSDVLRTQNILNDTLLKGFQKNFELRMKRHRGLEFFAETSFGLINSLDKNSDSFVIVVKNIDERKAYERNLRIAKEKAEESDRLKTAFLSNMSHEIRTPMNAIIGFSELLSYKSITETEREEFIQQINNGADSLMRLIDDIIDISKIEAGQIRINNTSFNLKSVLKDLETLYAKNMLRQKKTSIQLVLDNNSFNPELNIFSDEMRFRQVFSNLLNNALKFTETGEIRFGVYQVKNDMIHFYVRDTGIGIPASQQKLIFERFRQGHSTKNKLYGGTGLGLSISKHFIELMGGTISVASEEGKGSEFKFTIPLKSTFFEKPGSVLKMEISGCHWSGKSILVAEDDVSNFFLLSEILKKTQAKILWAKDGIEVVTIFEKNPEIDLILMDIQLPFRNGYECTGIIKNINPGVPVIAQTAYAMSGEQEKSARAGCDGYLSKPIKLNELLTVLSRYLNK
jgi:PAS domain S-box-containing protein